MGDALFRRDGDLLVPTELAGGPWAPGFLHGGSPAGLLARAVEQHIGDSDYQMVRLTVDLFRAVPAQPLKVTAETVRGGRRIRSISASIWADGVEVTRASAAFLLRSDMPGLQPPAPLPLPPEVAPPTDGFFVPRAIAGNRPILPGLHRTVRTMWPAEDSGAMPACWVSLPVPLVEGEATSPASLAATLSDFGNALANRREIAGQEGGSYINSDITLTMDRDPVGDWLCIELPFRQEIGGVGHAETNWYDRNGRYGHVVQSRLGNPRS